VFRLILFARCRPRTFAGLATLNLGGDTDLRDAPDRPPAIQPAADKAPSVRRMFSAIAPRYDLLNHLLTLNIDRRWRARAVDRLMEGARSGDVYLDACAGTMDLAVEVAGRGGFSGLVVASDFALPMLERGQPKVRALPVVASCGDALVLPHPDGAFAGAIVGFGVRNFSDLDAGLRELRRVIRPGGRLVVLELSVPPSPALRWVFLLYFTRILPRIGRAISGHRSAYTYLPDSVRAFPAPPELAERMTRAGFTAVRYERLMAGIAAVHVGQAAQQAEG
jgi:demethylmenaquinone methyltransferase / 2-methoxy-6-polyprenyl-1,4-benzoquinol methylase